MLLLFAGAVIVTVGTPPRVTVTVAVFEPNAFEQATAIVLAPVARPTLLVEVLVEAAPLTVQVVPLGIVEPPLTVYETLIELAVVFVPFAGDVITGDGAEPWFTVTDALPLPNELVQATVMPFAPALRLTELVVALVVAVPLTVQVVPLGIEAAPLTVNATLVVLAEVLLLFAGEVIATVGAEPRLTTTEAEAVLPAESVQLTVIVLAPTLSATLEPLAGVQVGVPMLSAAV